jgi:hypothetical protein
MKKIKNSQNMLQGLMITVLTYSLEGRHSHPNNVKEKKKLKMRQFIIEYKYMHRYYEWWEQPIPVQ